MVEFAKAPSFFYRFSNMQFLPGRSGFELAVSSAVLWSAARAALTREAALALQQEMQARVYRSGVLGRRACSRLFVAFDDSTAAVRLLGIDEETPGRLEPMTSDLFSTMRAQPVSRIERFIGPEARYVASGVERPQQALALLVMAQTWLEWLPLYLALGERAKKSPAGAGLEAVQYFDGPADSSGIAPEIVSG